MSFFFLTNSLRKENETTYVVFTVKKKHYKHAKKNSMCRCGSKYQTVYLHTYEYINRQTLKPLSIEKNKCFFLNIACPLSSITIKTEIRQLLCILFWFI